MSKVIYLDNSATTPLDPEVLEAMMPYLSEAYGNPSSIYSLGAQAHEAIENAREQVAAAIGARPEEIYFTSGATEADNWAIRSAAYQNAAKGKHIISTRFEHHAVLHTLDQLEKEGFEITLLEVHEDGIVRPEELRAAIRPDTILITIMYANNEIGTIQPIAELGAIAHEAGILFHTDAVQAFSQAPIDVKAQHIDLLSLSAHKFNGPKGTGCLYVRKGVRLPNFVFGGGQEKRKRPGTENVAGIVGMGKAAQMAAANLEAHVEHLTKMRDRLIAGLLQIPHTRLNGHPTKRLAGNVNLSIQFIEGESLLLNLDMNGIAASSGSACTSGSLDPSHVLLAIGLPHEIAHGSLRLSLGKYNTMSDVEKVIDVLPGIVSRLRAMSPLYEAYRKEHPQTEK